MRSLSHWIRHERQELFVAVLCIAMVAFLVKFIEFHGWLASAEGKAIDMLLRADTFADQPSDKRIAVLPINDEAYRDCFDSTSPLRSDVLLPLVNAIAAEKPAVLGVDLLTEGDRPADAQAFQEWQMKSRPNLVVPILWAAGGKLNPERERSWMDWMNGRFLEIDIDPSHVLGAPVNPKEEKPLWGVPAFPREDDSIVRRLPRKIRYNGTVQSSWSVRMVEEYCEIQLCSGRKAEDGEDEVFLSYKNAKLDVLSFQSHFTCERPQAGVVVIRPTQPLDVRNKIVLLGGAYGGQDVHDTAQGPIPGVLMNAFSIRAELDGSGVNEMHHWSALALDILTGILIAFPVMFWKWKLQQARQDGRHPRSRQFIRWMILIYVFAAILLVITSVALMSRGMIWVSWVGMSAAIMMGLFIDLYRENPQVDIAPLPK